MHGNFRDCRRAILLALLVVSACTSSGTNEASTPVARSLATETNIAVYGSEGPILRQYTLELSTGQLVAGSSVSFPAGVQYAAVARKADHLYVSAGNQPLNSQLFAFDIAPGSGALSPRGAPLSPSGGRSINLSVNHQGTHLALAHSSANRAATVELAADGSMVAEVPQTGATATGPFPHQAKFDHAGQNLIVPGLALNGGDGTLTVFGFGEGQLTHAQTVTLAPGLGARHVEFDHSGRFVYLAVERGNRLHTHRFADGLLSATPIFDRTTLEDPLNNALARQRAGAIHAHPSARFLYLSNRQDVLDGTGALPGENNIAVFALDVATGEPTPIQHIDTRGVEARSFTIEPTGQYLIVGNQVARTVNGVVIPPSLAVFRIGADGKLSFLHKYVAGGEVFWVGSVAL
jgi:6-phosphogluconolactonase (cycloisomerase 2 family)